MKELPCVYCDHRSVGCLQAYCDKFKDYLNTFIDIKDKQPDDNLEIEYIDSEGHMGWAFKSGMEWRCTITGGGLMIDVMKWRYIND